MGEPARVRVECSCGKQLLAQAEFAGKTVKCPSCGHSLVVPSGIGNTPRTPALDESAGLNPTTLTVLWSIAGVVVLGAVAFAWMYSRSSHDAAINAANQRVSTTITSAKDWLSQGSLDQADRVEQDLTNALKDELATQKLDGESVMTQIRSRRDSLLAQSRIQQSQQTAARLLSDAKLKIEAQQISAAIELLRRYVSDQHATDKASAERLLGEAELATSDAKAVESLISLTDDEFNTVKEQGVLNDGKVTHPALAAMRNDLLQKNLDAANQQRVRLRLAEASRRETARLAAIDRAGLEEKRRVEQEAELRIRQASAPLKVFLGGELTGKHAAFYRLLPAVELKEEQKGGTGNIFDRAEQGDWESKFVVQSISLAPGALMNISVENYSGGAFGPHSEWLSSITVAIPPGVEAYQGVSLSHAVGEEVESWSFELAGTAEMDGMTLAMYRFQETLKLATFTVHSPIDKVLARMTSRGAVKYRISTGPKGLGPVQDGELSREAVNAIVSLLKKAKFKNWQDKSPYSEDWMER